MYLLFVSFLMWIAIMSIATGGPVTVGFGIGFALWASLEWRAFWIIRQNQSDQRHNECE